MTAGERARLEENAALAGSESQAAPEHQAAHEQQAAPAEGAALAPQSSPRAALVWTLAGLAVVLALAGAVRFLTAWVPEATAGTAVGGVAEAVEYPVYAIALGFLGNAVLSLTGLRRRMAAAFRTEFFIKIGLVLLGASIDFAIVVRAAGPAMLQAILLIAAVFGFTWWFAGRLGLDDRLRALLASSLSICGVSAAVAAAGAVQAKKEQLAFTATLVVVFAVPSIFLLPFLADLMGLSDAVTGAWIGGNIDTTAAVTAAGAVAGEQALQIASIVKITQNALLGIVAVLLTLYFAFKVAPQSAAPQDDAPQDDATAAAGSSASASNAAAASSASASAPRSVADRASLALIWGRFPKFVLGFLVASVLATILGQTMDPSALEPALKAAKGLQTWALILAFVSIGLEFNVSSAREAGWRPVAVFAVATLVNLLVGLGLALLLFSGFTF